MLDVSSVFKRAAEKIGLERVRYKEKNIPTSIENVVVFPFFGDHRSSFVLSSILLKRIKEELKGSKYFILISWPGHEGLFPYVDEYWEVKDESMIEKLRFDCLGFENTSQVFTLIVKNLNQYFYDVMTDKDLSSFYKNGITKEFFERFKHVKVFLPSVPSSASLGVDVARTLNQKQSKIFIYPSKEVYGWKFSNIYKSKCPKEFWVECLNYLLKKKIFPIVFSDIFSYDLSPDVTENCLHLKNQDLLKVLGIMRSSNCVVDFFSGISRFAIASRAPFVCFDDRSKFNGLKDYEINDLCGKKIPKEYVFGFSTIIESGDSGLWETNLFKFLDLKLNKIYEIDRDLIPSSAEVDEIVPYDSVRKFKNKKIGTKFVKIDRF